jgi:transcriptional regulator with XRE-family HTH domain
MDVFRLDNYLRTHRRRFRFSQDEVAFLLGTKSGTKVSRYEHGTREPSLETALAYEILFGRPLKELFAGKVERIERTLAKRAGDLLAQLSAQPETDPGKIEVLRALTSNTPHEQ